MLITTRLADLTASTGRDRSTGTSASRSATAVWRRLLLAITPAAACGVALSLLMPRGPMTNIEAVLAIVAGTATGVAVGLWARTRWVYVAAPLAFISTYELFRLGVDGPTVDGLHTSLYGAIAFVTGRGLVGATAVLPLLLGIVAGRAIVRPRTTRTTVRASAALLAVLALAIPFARPATTDPIVGPDGAPLQGSIAELTHVDVNGRDLGLMIRGHDTDNPVLLFLAGGPGGTELGAMRRHLSSLEEHFTVATWDQRGTGRSYAALDPTDTYTPQSAVDDTVAITRYLRERFGEDRIYLVGQSWGTILGVQTVQAHPELFHAYIGTGQMVSPLETDRVFYRDTLQWARDTGNDNLVATLETIGEPPYDSILHYEPALSLQMEVYSYDHGPNSEAGGFSENLLVEEYSLVDQWHAFAGFLDTYTVLYPQIQDVDFRRDVPRLEVPSYFVQGRHEAPGRTILFEEWYPLLEAPVKQRVEFDTSGHRPLFEQPEAFTGYLVDTVLAQTSPDA